MPVMQTSDLTPRQYWEQVKSNPNRARFGFGNKAALINIDMQRHILVCTQHLHGLNSPLDCLGKAKGTFIKIHLAGLNL